jgi:2-furoyl-CoA dehydrogenase large subunit
VILDLDPLEVIRRNLVETFPYRCPAGAVLDSGDYGVAVNVAVARGRLAELRRHSDLARTPRNGFVLRRVSCGGPERR